MSKIESERGKNLKAPLVWVDFVISNPDIMAALNGNFPLQAKMLDNKKFLLSIFRVQVLLEEVHHDLTEKQGTLKWFADIRSPWGFGKTHSICTYTCFPIDEDTTSLDFSISIELTTLSMRVYAWLIRNAIDAYLNKLCRQIEHAAKVMKQEPEDAARILDEDQRQRVEEFRHSLLRKRQAEIHATPKLEGALRVVMSESSLLVTAEARMPDQRILSANGRFTFTPEEMASLRSGILRLAGINNRAASTRGDSGETAECADFRQAALEYGYKFFRKVCADQLMTVVPVIANQGCSAVLRISVDGEAEQLPWEAMHDGQEFICIKTCLSRSVMTIYREPAVNHQWQQAGILVLGADSRGDLPGVEQETKGIGRVLSSAGIANVEVLTGQKATRRSVLKALQSEDYGILHFSGHSVFDSEHPYQSYLELCGGGKIFMHELGHFGRSAIQGSPLRLVFLNSCQSARVGHDALTGRQLSMCKALRESGVPFVIGMLWNVEDEAAVQVGSHFYGNLMRSPEMGPEGAMRETRLAVAIERSWADGSWLAPVLYC